MSSAGDFTGAAPETHDGRRERVERGQIVIGSDVPREGAEEVHLRAPVRVVGWAYSRPGIERVEVLVDGTRVPAQYGLFRQDVADVLSEPDAVRSGFTAVLDDAVGARTLAIVATDRAGQTAELTIPIVVEGRADDGDGAAALDNEGERYVPEDYRGTPTEVEHQARYSWVAPLATGRDVLDAGCGVGWGTVRLSRAGARRAVGVDIDEPALANARERAKGSAEFIRGDLLELPLPDASFDVVVCFEAIEHVAEPERALDEVKRVLRPGGLLAVSSPNRGVYPAGNPHHLHELTYAELEASLRSRFANVAMYRQQTLLAALLTDDEGHAAADPEVEISGHLYKTSGGRPGDELYTIGLASDSSLPALGDVAVLGGTGVQDYVRLLEQNLTFAQAKSTAARAEADAALERAAALARSLEEEQKARQEVELWLADLRASVSWRITSPLRAAKQAARGDRGRSGST